MKTVLKKIACLLYYLAHPTVRNSDGGLLVVTYHRISEQADPSDPLKISVSTFEKQIRFLKQAYSVISAESLNDAVRGISALPANACLITFDDGWKDNYTLGFPTLRKYELPAMIFVSTDYIGTSNVFWQVRLRRILTMENNITRFAGAPDCRWPHQVASKLNFIVHQTAEQRSASINDLIEIMKKMPLRDIEMILFTLMPVTGFTSDTADAMLTWDQVFEMTDHGIGFGSHARSHAILTQLDGAELRDEVAGSKRILEQNLGSPVNFMAYPNGNYDQRILQEAKDAGYSACFSCSAGVNRSLSLPFELKRINMREDSAVGIGTDFSHLFYKVELSGARFHLKDFLRVGCDGYDSSI